MTTEPDVLTGLSAGTGISLSGVEKTYGQGPNAVHALRGVDLVVPGGQVVALTGRSGAGIRPTISPVAGSRKKSACS